MAFKKVEPLVNNLTDDSIYFGDSDLWGAACSGNSDFIHNYYKNGGKVNQRFNGFGKNHSLIMGATRNGNWDIVDALQKYGETLLPEEQPEFDYFNKNYRGK